MSKPPFETYWIVSGEQYFNLDEVTSLVEAGHLAREVSAEKQANDYKLRMMQEAWHRRSIERHAKHVAETTHRQTPEGRRESIVRHAALHPGGIVSGAESPIFDELDEFGADATNLFK